MVSEKCILNFILVGFGKRRFLEWALLQHFYPEDILQFSFSLF
jgi:hypothetical protein